jgi:SAM-dependent methyltransferase
MIRIPAASFDEVVANYGVYFERTSKVPARKLASDVLNEEKVHDQVALLCHVLGVGAESLRGKRVLEIGSGFGLFVAVTRIQYGMESYGLEPAAAGFASSHHTSLEILRANGLDPEIIVNASGEAIPFPDDHFDVLFSSTALEHTENPERVLDESLRVLKPGGCLHFVFPNYGSFFEGHYALPWIPYLPHWLGRPWVQLWGRDPEFLGTLQFTNYFRTRRWIASRHDVDLVTMGEEIFAERMRTMSLKDGADWGVSSERSSRAPAARRSARHLAVSPNAVLRSDRAHAAQARRGGVATEADNQQIYDENWPQWLDMKRHGPSSRWLRRADRRSARWALRAPRSSGAGLRMRRGTTTEFLAARCRPRASWESISPAPGSTAPIPPSHANLSPPPIPVNAVSRGGFDLVTCFEVLEHVDDWQALASRLAHASSRYLLVSFPTGRMRDFEVNIGHLRNFRPGEFEAFMERIGFRTVEVFYAGFPFYSPLFRDVCNLTNSAGNTLTRGHYSFWTQRLADLILFSFRFLSTRRRGGDQFCGLFEVAGRGEAR